MDIFLRDDKEGFERYLLADLEIPMRFYRRLEVLMARVGLGSVPPTLGSAAVAKFHKVLLGLTDSACNPVTPERLFGVKLVKERTYSRARARLITRTRSELTVARLMSEPLMAAAYHGGRTEVYETGPSPPGEVVHDIDEKSAYPSAESTFGVPDYEATYWTTEPSHFTAGALGAAEVEFFNPAALRGPALVARSQFGLLAPTAWVTVTTAPEIASALHLGVEVRIRRGVIIPWAPGGAKPLLQFNRELLELREQLKADEAGADGRVTRVDTLESLIVKTIANSLYGKMAQAVRPRNVFDTRTVTIRSLPPSPVSSAAFASHITGLVRASIAEMINSIPPHRRLLNVSTDGFATTAAIEEIDVSGPACRLLAASRLALTGDPLLVEYKKGASQLVVPRSRAAFTAVPAPGSKPILARGGIKVPRGTANPRDDLLGLHLDRTAETRNPREDLISRRDQYARDADLVSVPRQPRVNLEPDSKRHLTEPRMVAIAGGPHEGREHLATSSVPHPTVDAMAEERTLFDGWRHATGRGLKTMEDWNDWTDYRDTAPAARAAWRRPHRTAGGSADELKRPFLRALVRGWWGVGIGTRSHRSVAEWLTGAGYKTSLAAVKNATRPAAVPVEHSVAATERTLDLLYVLLDEYPEFEHGRAFVRGHAGKVDERLRERVSAAAIRARALAAPAGREKAS